MTIHDALHQIDPEKGKQLAAQYFEESSSFPGTGTFTGSHFESFAGAPNPVNEVTAADLLAVQTLAVTVSSRAALGILETYAQRISELLSDIGPTLKLEEVRDEGDFEAVLGKNSSAQALWDLLRRNNPEAKRWNLGATTASKIMARKRPHLIPIDDSVVTRVIGRGRRVRGECGETSSSLTTTSSNEPTRSRSTWSGPTFPRSAHSTSCCGSTARLSKRRVEHARRGSLALFLSRTIRASGELAPFYFRAQLSVRYVSERRDRRAEGSDVRDEGGLELSGVAGVDLRVRSGEMVALIGPSGSGKTTLLRRVAGLDPLPAGTVRIAGRDMARVPVERRPATMLFETPVLFPQLTVEENVGFALDVAGHDVVVTA